MQFKQVTPRLPVANLQRTLEFYRDVLGFSVDVLWPEQSPTFCIVRRDAVSLGFFVPDEHRKPTVPGGSDLYIEVEHLEQLHDALQNKVRVEWGPEVYSYGRREFAFYDPDGYLIIVTQPTPDPATCQVDAD